MIVKHVIQSSGAFQFQGIYFNTLLIHKLKCNRCPPPLHILDASPSGNKKQINSSVFQHMDKFYLPVISFQVCHLYSSSNTRYLKLWSFGAPCPRKSHVSSWLVLSSWLTVKIIFFTSAQNILTVWGWQPVFAYFIIIMLNSCLCNFFFFFFLHRCQWVDWAPLCQHSHSSRTVTPVFYWPLWQSNGHHM